jgi:hypothetical protein
MFVALHLKQNQQVDDDFDKASKLDRFDLITPRDDDSKRGNRPSVSGSDSSQTTRNFINHAPAPAAQIPKSQSSSCIPRPNPVLRMATMPNMKQRPLQFPDENDDDDDNSDGNQNDDEVRNFVIKSATPATGLEPHKKGMPRVKTLSYEGSDMHTGSISATNFSSITILTPASITTPISNSNRSTRARTTGRVTFAEEEISVR